MTDVPTSIDKASAPALRPLASDEIESISGGLTVATVCRNPLVFNFLGIRFIFCRN